MFVFKRSILAPLVALATSLLLVSVAPLAIAQDANKEIRRGQYLVQFGGCHDCHTPKVMTAQGPVLDEARLLSGHPSHASLPALPPGVLSPSQWGAAANSELTAWAGPWGISFAANLTPDATGLGGWTAQQFMQAMRTGRHAGVGRPLLPPMPWFNVAVLTDQDLKALFAYLQSLKPISNQVPQPIAPKVTAAR